jgi:protein-S-isoprenylcysteine O-methyltransferase Ste14
MVGARAAAARAAYGGLFVIVLPVGLALWAGGSAHMVPLPAVRSVAGGAGLIALGVLLMAAGGRELVVRGEGLPMNAFPPPRLVRTGIYRWVRNPMYLGFGLACAGASIALGSAAGLWLVTPVVCLAAAALVHGYEVHDLRRRFGATTLTPPLLSLPRGNGAPATAAHRAAVYVWVLVPWVIAYAAVQLLGRAPDTFVTALPFERALPVVQWTELLYASAYLLVPLTVVVIRTQGALARFAVQGLILTVIVTLVWLTVPVVAANRVFVPTTFPGRLLAYEQAHSNGVAAFPAFHILWALIAAEGWSSNGRQSDWPWAAVGWSWAVIISVSALTTGMHTVVEIVAAVGLYLIVRNYGRAWSLARELTERVANSWTEWRVGPVRAINHGFWAAAAAGVGLLIAGAAAGPDRLGAVIWIAACVLLGAAVWAQMLEGSSKLLRPFGWYGGVLGGVAGGAMAGAAGVPVIPLLAAFAIAAPWIQILGRFRCLVQGCCHGGVAREGVGIRYGHARSRVTRLADLAGVPLHATPLYSIVSNVVVGVVLVRLRMLGAPNELVIGIFLILGGLARFVEESYRGEPQTPVVGGLRIYQWLAIVSVVAGAVCTTFPAGGGPVGFTPPTAALAWAAVAVAAVTGFAMGVDFPTSDRRFSRLASADPLLHGGAPANRERPR